MGWSKGDVVCPQAAMPIIGRDVHHRLAATVIPSARSSFPHVSQEESAPGATCLPVMNCLR